MCVLKRSEIAGRLGSVELGSMVGVIVVVMVVDPLNTPTTLTLEVSTILRKVQRLLMKLVDEVLLLKKLLMFMLKWVVSCNVSVS